MVEQLPSYINEELREAGDELQEEHEENIFQDIIERVEDLDDPNSELTADMLREMLKDSE